MLKGGPGSREALDSPAAWFAVLERARRDRDYARAAQALQELERLGVRVKYRRRPSAPGGQTHA
jgi:hypothetical protein